MSKPAIAVLSFFAGVLAAAFLHAQEEKGFEEYSEEEVEEEEQDGRKQKCSHTSI